MTWHAYLVETMTGRVGRRLTSDTGTGGSWSITLNGIEEATVTVDAAAFRRLDPDWWAAWKSSVLLTHTGPEGEVPILLGPIVKPAAQKGDAVTLTIRGVGAILERRVVLARDFLAESGTASAATMKELAGSVASMTGRSLGTIARDVVDLVTTGKTAGRLPIRYGTPRETGSRLNQRNYYGFNLANNGAWKRLEELANVINGPDFAFRPAWASEDRSRVEWVMVHGTAAQPVIHQERRLVFDTTAGRSALSDLEVTADAGEVTNRVYWTGAGEGAGILATAVQELEAFGEYMPLLETVGSTSDTDNRDLVEDHARAALRKGRDVRVQYTGVLNLADRRTAAGLWHVGDAADLIIAGRVDVPDGRRSVRIIAAKGSLGSDLVTVELEHEGGPDGPAA